MDVTLPILRETQVDGQIVYTLRHNVYAECVRKMRKIEEEKAAGFISEFLSHMQERKDFTT
jgi:hypothetical protein